MSISFRPSEIRPIWMPTEPVACTSDPVRWIGDRPAESARLECLSCPVIAECLVEAVESRAIHGIWGAIDFGQPKGRAIAARMVGRIRQTERSQSRN